MPLLAISANVCLLFDNAIVAMTRTPRLLAGGDVAAHDLAGAAAADTFVGLAASCLDLGEMHALGIRNTGLG